MTGALAADLLMGPALEVRALTTEFAPAGALVRAVDGVSFTVDGGQVVAVVGESGSGKSVLLQSILGLVRGDPGVVAGQVILRFRDGTEHRPFLGLEGAIRRAEGTDEAPGPARVSRRWRAQLERRMRAVRGRRVGLVLQNGRAALDPFYTVGQQLTAAVVHDRPVAKAEHWLERLGFDDPARAMKLYPHELSGGMAQRVMLGLVLAQEPELLLLDEITTGLDVSLQASVIDLLGRLYQEVGFSAVLVTHDLGVARSLSSRAVIMRRGRVEQEASTPALFEGRVPLTPYAERLLKYGRVSARRRRGAQGGLEAPVRLRATGVGKSFGGQGWLAGPRREVLRDVSVTIIEGQCVALVGESGSGKTTLTRILAGLTRPDSGRVDWAGRSLGALDGPTAARIRRARTVLFQSPYTSLNPAMTGRAAVAEALVHDLGLSRPVADEEAARRLGVVGLAERADQPLAGLSGGERRRVGLIAALSAPAEVLVLDEPTAGLDAEHRAGVRQLLRLAREHQPQRSIVLVSHDMGFVVGAADRIVVLFRGAVVEEADAADFADPDEPHHPYTQLLWDASRYVAGAVAAPNLMPGYLDPEEAPPRAPGAIGPAAPPDVGCAFRPRCPMYRGDSGRWTICEHTAPVLIGAEGRRRIACHGVRDADLE